MTSLTRLRVSLRERVESVSGEVAAVYHRTIANMILPDSEDAITAQCYIITTEYISLPRKSTVGPTPHVHCDV